MKYAKDRKLTSSHTAEVLIEAFPYIKNQTGKTIVIKYGGAAMVDPKLRDAVMSDIVMLKIMGVNPVIVHGGGADISRNMERFGIDVEFIDGLRVTTEEAMEVVKMTLIGKVNEELVRAMNQHGNLAVGVNGADAGTIVAEQVRPELGRVGSVIEVNPAYLKSLINAAYVPIIASVGKGEDGGSFNINADAVACAVAGAIGAQKIIFLTDVDGLYENYPDPDSLIAEMSLGEAEAMVRGDKLASGMIPKLASCVRALDSGVSAAHIINGTVPHALLLEMLTDSGMGTMVGGLASAQFLNVSPVSKFAAKLIENR